MRNVHGKGKRRYNERVALQQRLNDGDQIVYDNVPHELDEHANKAVEK